MQWRMVGGFHIWDWLRSLWVALKRLFRRNPYFF